MIKTTQNSLLPTRRDGQISSLTVNLGSGGGSSTSGGGVIYTGGTNISVSGTSINICQSPTIIGDLLVTGNIRACGDVSAFSAAEAPLNWWDNLPTASATVKGGVKIGCNLSIDANGVLSSTGGGVSSWNDLLDKPLTFAPATHNNSQHSETYITGINSSMVTTALGFTPYNNSNPSGFITSAALSSYAPLANPRFTGTMGIGTTSPSSTLDIHGGKFVIESNNGAYGQFQILNTENSESTIIFASNVTSGQGGVVLATDPKYIWATGAGAYGVGQDKFVITGNVGYAGPIMIATHIGNVGIGTSSPTRQLHIKANGATHGYVKVDADTGYDSGLVIASNGTDNTYLYRAGGDDTFRIYKNGADRLTITPAGNVGIGETNPASTLTVRKDAQGSRGGELSIINYAVMSVGNNAALNFGLESSTYAGDDGNAQIKATVTAVNGASDMSFSLWSGSVFSERMRIISNGNIATTNNLSIGSAYPGQSSTPAYLSTGPSFSDGATWTKMKLKLHDTGYGFSVGSNADVQYFTQGRHDFFTAGDALKFRIINTGAEVTGNFSATGEVTAFSSSDERLKTNIQPFYALDIINKIQPVTFNWNERAKELNNKKDSRNNYGVIAQQLEEVLPELVHSGLEDYKSVDYVQLIPILLQAVKELQLELADLKNNNYEKRFN